MGIARQVKWNTEEIDRDNLSDATRNTLGSTLTVFRVPDFAVNELLQGKNLHLTLRQKFLVQLTRKTPYPTPYAIWK